MLTAPFDDSIDPQTEKPLKLITVTFTADYDPDRSEADADETPVARPRPTLEHPAPTDYSEMVPGELDHEPLPGSYKRTHRPDLDLEEQMSQFRAAPWDEGTEEEPPDGWPVIYNYVELERLKRTNPDAYDQYMAAMEASRSELDQSNEGRDIRILDY